MTPIVVGFSRFVKYNRRGRADSVHRSLSIVRQTFHLLGQCETGLTCRGHVACVVATHTATMTSPKTRFQSDDGQVKRSRRGNRKNNLRLLKSSPCTTCSIKWILDYPSTCSLIRCLVHGHDGVFRVRDRRRMLLWGRFQVTEGYLRCVDCD